ncbi:universal stress protein [Rhodobacteraceae bacterium D3-12]|nr:universal stress protein [Rhodobacteraceae bacterium D3-12]
MFDAPALRLSLSGTITEENQQIYLDGEKHTAERDLAEFVASSELGECRKIVRHETTSAPREILKAAQSEKADLIVLSTRGRSVVNKMILGSVTEQVLRVSTIDVLAIPPTSTALPD